MILTLCASQTQLQLTENIQFNGQLAHWMQTSPRDEPYLKPLYLKSTEEHYKGHVQYSKCTDNLFTYSDYLNRELVKSSPTG